jgi:hypothetical protein
LFARPFLNYKDEEVDEKYSVSICIPARNESGNIENAILRLPKFAKHQEIIFMKEILQMILGKKFRNTGKIS